jgi:hypothetical protein
MSMFGDLILPKKINNKSPLPPPIDKTTKWAKIKIIIWEGV